MTFPTLVVLYNKFDNDFFWDGMTRALQNLQWTYQSFDLTDSVESLMESVEPILSPKHKVWKFHVEYRNYTKTDI